MKKRLYIFIALIILALSFTACGEKQDSAVLSRDFQGEVWNRFDCLEASYNVIEPMTADVVMDIYVSDVYPNVYPHHDDDGSFTVTMSIKGPDGSGRVREYRFRLKDKDGNFKSEKVDGYYHFSLPMLSEMYFGAKGDYRFKIENRYSYDPLYGIKRLSINCLQIKKIK